MTPSFHDLVANQSPKTFRDFLLSAPYMFLELGEKLGGISHIVSFWRYRFPQGSPPNVDAEELSAIFQDFSSGFGEKIKGESSADQEAGRHRYDRRLSHFPGIFPSSFLG